jgi:hypothetical protein
LEAVVMEFASRFFIYLPNGPLAQISPREAGRIGAPESPWRLPALAGLRMRLVEARLVREGSVAHRVHDMRFSWLPLDASGRFDRDAWDEDELARIAQLALSKAALRPIDAATASAVVVDAANRFRARHASWQPSSTERQELQRAALGTIPVPRLKGVLGNAGRRRRPLRSAIGRDGRPHVDDRDHPADKSRSRGNAGRPVSRTPDRPPAQGSRP